MVSFSNLTDMINDREGSGFRLSQILQQRLPAQLSATRCTRISIGGDQARGAGALDVAQYIVGYWVCLRDAQI